MLTYLDSSVALAYLFSETRFPAAGFWRQRLTSSRLLEYEIWNRIHVRGSTAAVNSSALALLSGIGLLEMSGEALARALEPWPAPIRTLDALHLATADYLRRQGESVELASYDRRLLDAARALGIPIAVL